MEENPHEHDIDLSKISVDEVMKLEFEGESDADSFYNALEKSMGFAIRKDELYKSKEGNFLGRQWLCSCAGKRSEKELNRQVKIYEPRQNCRTDCKARLRIKYDKSSDVFRVTKFNNVHNHGQVSPICVHFLRSHRMMTSGDCDLAKGMYKVGMKISRIYTFMATQVGGYECVGFTYKDLCNQIARERQNDMVDGDAEGAIGYMAAMREVDPMFYFRYDKDDENKLARLFWADGACRSDYSIFGDVLLFYATYRRNVYNMPFVILIGVNNHNRTVLFGCTMMADETLQSYTWLLNTFLTAMHEKHPTSVITDGDPAMRGAIKNVFPRSKHWLCSWHLERNAQRNIKHGGFSSRFTKCMKMRTVAEFEEAWEQLLVDYNLKDHNWCTDMYEKRELWAESYMRVVFFADLTTTNRSEGINSYFKGFLQTRMRLFEVVRGYNFGQEKLRKNSLRLQAMDESGKPVLSTGLRSLERHASEIYTRTMFIKFRNEIEKVQLLWHNSPVDFSTYRAYFVFSYGDNESKWTVLYYHSVPALNCDCNKFDNLGIPCAHMIHVMKVENMKEIPTSCILQRWTKRDTSYVTKVHEKNETQPIKFGALTNACSRFSYYASHLKDGYVKARDAISSLTREVEVLYLKEVCNKDGSENHNEGEQILHDVLDPTLVRGKGRPKNIPKGVFPQKRKCSYCKNTGHNIKGCTLRLEELEQESESAQQPTPAEDNMNMFQQGWGNQQNQSSQYYNMHGYSSTSQPSQSFAAHGFYPMGQPSYYYGMPNYGSTQYIFDDSNQINNDSDDYEG